MTRGNSYLLILLLLIVSCISAKDKMIYILHLPDRNIEYEGNIVENRSAADTIHIYPDTMLSVSSNKEEKCLLIKAGKGSNISGIFYLHFSQNNYEVLQQFLDPYTVFDIDISFHDIDKELPPEVVSLWTHEGDTYYIRIDQVNENCQVENIFTSKDLGVPWIEGGRQMYVQNDSLIFLYMLEDGSAHEKALLTYDSGKLDFRVIQKIPYQDE